MTVFSKTFDTATPAGSDDPAEADDRMQEIKAAVQERENVDHYWPLTGTEVSDADAGEHRKATLRTGSAPSAVADKGFVYVKDISGKTELFYRGEDGNEIQITSGGILNSLNLTGAQTAAGVKTFSSIPKIPTTAPTADAEVAGRKFVVDQVTAKDVKASGASVFNATMTAANTFQDLDLSGVVGANLAMVCLEVTSNGASIYVAKTKGFGGAVARHWQSSGKDYGGAQFQPEGSGEFAYMTLMTNSSGVIQHAGTNNTTTWTVKLIGYVK